MERSIEIEGKNKLAEMGRIPTEIDWEELDKLCAMQCTIDEISAWFGCSRWTIGRAVKRRYGKTFATYFEQKRGAGKVSIRRKQFQRATQDGSDTMLIWLGKQYLKQSDKQELSGSKDNPIYLDFLGHKIEEKHTEDSL